MKHKKIIVFIITILISISFIHKSTIVLAKILPDSSVNKKILILNPSNHSGFESAVLDGISQYLSENLPESEITTDTTINRDINTIETNFQCLITKSKQFDLIICLDEESLKIIDSDIGKKYFGSTPVIFALAADSVNLNNLNINGYFIKYNFKDFVNQILKLHPKTKSINILVDNNFKNSFYYKDIYKFIENNNTDINYKIIQSGLDTDIIKPLTEKNSVNIIFAKVKSKIGLNEAKYQSENITMKTIATFTDNPTYGGFTEYCTNFNIGGYNASGFNFGIDIGKLSVDTIKNSNNKNIGIKEYKSEELLLINKSLMKNYKIKPNLPNISYQELSNGETSFVKKRNLYLSLIFIILLVAMIGLIFNQLFTRKNLKEQVRIDSMKTNFIANVSHELRTPLNIIISTIQLIDIYLKNGDMVIKNNSVHEKIKYLKNNSNRLLRLVNNIIDITKIDAGFFTIDKSLNDIVSVVEDIALSTVPYAEKKNINLVFDTDIEELYFSFDKDRIERVFLNLLSNSIKFTPPEGTIYVNINHTNDELIATVKDNGIGIPKDKQDLIFKRFRQANDTVYNKSEGSGIGLSICKSMIELHNGSITVESDENIGSTFTVKIPIDNSDLNGKDLAPKQSSKEKTQLEFSDLVNYI